MAEGMRGGKPMHECSVVELGLTLLDRGLADGGQIKKRTGVEPAMFYYAVAMAEEILEANPGIVPLKGGMGRASDPGRRARLQPRHIVYLRMRCASTRAPPVAIAAEAGIGQRAASRYVAIAGAVLSMARRRRAGAMHALASGADARPRDGLPAAAGRAHWGRRAGPATAAAACRAA